MRLYINIDLDPVYRARQIKWFFQRIFRGYSDSDLWSLDYFILKKIRKPFKEFVKTYDSSIPGCFCFTKDMKPISDDIASRRWKKVLTDIEEALDLSWIESRLDQEWMDKTTEERDEANKKITKGLKLFGKYYGCFWT